MLLIVVVYYLKIIITITNLVAINNPLLIHLAPFNYLNQAPG